MPDCMEFPDDWHKFLEDYSFKDSEHIYTNGSDLIQVFRVEQLIEHLLGAPVEAVDDADDPWLAFCGKCGHALGFKKIFRYCPYCGKMVKWK